MPTSPPVASAIQQQADIFFDDQALDCLDELAALFNLRQVRSQQLLTRLDEIQQVDQRIHKLSRYLAQQQSALKDYSADFIAQNQELDMATRADVFALALNAFTSDDKQWIEPIVSQFINNSDCCDGLALALAFLPKDKATPWLYAFLASKNLDHKWLGARACSLTGQYPAAHIAKLLAREDCQGHHSLYAQLLFLTGQMKDRSQSAQLIAACDHDNTQIKSQALWARLVLGDHSVLPQACEYSLQDNNSFALLSPWIILGRDMPQAKLYLAQAMQQSELAMDLKIKAIGHHGDPGILGWLLQTTEADALQPWLGLVFSQITGLDISAQQQSTPPTLEDDIDPALTYLDQDNSLIFPSREKLMVLWQTIHSQYVAQERYFLGRSLQQNHGFKISQGHSSLILAQQTMHYYRALYDTNAAYQYFVPAR